MPPGDARFEAVYRADANPFGVGERWYERRKQAIVLAVLGSERYDVAWDCAAGTGHLALALADRCGTVHATDTSPRAVELARALTRDRPNVTCAESTLPAGGPDADLTLVTEVLHYLPEPDRSRALAMLADRSGELVAVHWRHLAHDAPVSGAAATDELARVLEAHGWERRFRHDDVDFVVAGWRGPQRSSSPVAASSAQ